MWEWLKDRLLFTEVSDITVWQDIVFSSFLIPIAIGFYKLIIDYWSKTRPLESLLKNFGVKNRSTLVFLSQLHACNDTGGVLQDQKYFILTPNPMPGIKNTMKKHLRQNIDPVWSEGDGECLADVYHVFGKSKSGKNIQVADTISDWGKWSNPIATIGFNPKTEKLIDKCEPIYFKLEGGNLSIPNSNVSLDSYVPNDAGIIQKTYLKNSDIPVLILAGLGVLGTSAAGYLFKEEHLSLGKLYGSNPFCMIFSVRTDEGRTSARPIAIYPKPKILNIVLHPVTYFQKSDLFRNESTQPPKEAL